MHQRIHRLNPAVCYNIKSGSNKFPLGTPFLLAPLDCDCELRQVYLPFDPIGDRVD